jgi:hypothetical protein
MPAVRTSPRGVLTVLAGADGLPAESGFTTAFWVLAGASLAAAGLALLVPITRRPVAVPEPVAVAAPVPAAAAS